MISKKEDVSGGINLNLSIAVACVLLCAVSLLYAAPSPLHVEGNKIKDPNGNIVVLRGVSMIDLGSTEIWWGGAINTIDRLTDQTDANGDSPGWYTKIIRVPIAPHDSPLCSNSPLTFNPSDPNDSNNPAIRALLRTVVDYCASKDVYVIIDYHHMANTYDEVAEVNAFWAYMAPEFAEDSHVLFELFNEPMNTDGRTEDQSWDSVRNDMQAWVNTVRKYAPDNLILVGTPRYCQILAPIVGNPILDDNIVYVSHLYPYHWLGRAGLAQSWFTNQIATCAAEYPVIMTEWGFTTDTAFGNDPPQYMNGTITNYGKPLKEFVEQYGISFTAWCASNSVWGSPIFYRDWSLRCGEGEMGCFVKDWLFETSGVEQAIDLTITGCKVTAGKVQGQDVFEASGTMASSPLILSSVAQIDINIVSLADGNEVLIYPETINFNSTQVKKGKYKYTYKISRGGEGAITSLTMDFSKGKFAIAAKNIDLTGLACPLRLDIRIGNYTLSGDVGETIVNGAKTIPTRLMRMYKDTLVVPPGKAKVKNSASALSDSLSVSGEIAVKDINDANLDEPSLVAQDVNIVWGNQTFTVPAGSFKAGKGHLYKCSKINVDPNASPDINDGIVTATIDFDKCTFAVSISKADLVVTSGDVVFGLRFADFNETDNLSF